MRPVRETTGHINKEVLDQLEQADLDKLDGIEEGANKTVVDSALNEAAQIRPEQSGECGPGR